VSIVNDLVSRAREKLSEADALSAKRRELAALSDAEFAARLEAERLQAEAEAQVAAEQRAAEARREEERRALVERRDGAVAALHAARERIAALTAQLDAEIAALRDASATIAATTKAAGDGLPPDTDAWQVAVPLKDELRRLAEQAQWFDPNYPWRWRSPAEMFIGGGPRPYRPGVTDQ
jgi:hypothetical protein